MIKKKSTAYTMVEVLIAGVIVVMLFASSVGAYIYLKKIVGRSMAENDLAGNANIILMRIIRGLREGSSAHGLRSASGFTIPAIGEIDYESPDGSSRRYYLQGSNIIYERTTAPTSQETIYTAEPGTAITLRFWEPAGYLDNEAVGIYIGLRRLFGGRTISGSVQTYVNLRNVPK